MKKMTMLTFAIMLFCAAQPAGSGVLTDVGGGVFFDASTNLLWIRDLSFFANRSYEEQLLEISRLNRANPLCNWRMATRAEVQTLGINDIREYFTSPPRYTWTSSHYLYHEYLGYAAEAIGYDAIGLYSNDEISWNWIFWALGNKKAYEHIGAWVVSSWIPGDVDGDGDIDSIDIRSIKIAAHHNTPASGPYDPRDVDGDGMITVNDAWQAFYRCTRDKCATQ